MGVPFPLPDVGAADLARARHARRALEQALDHGTALLAALGLPRLVDDGFMPIDSEAAGAALAEAVALLDLIDPDPDFEPSLGAPENHTTTVVLGETRQWHELPADQRRWAQGADDSREADVVDEPHDEDTDVELTALEIHGKGFRQSGTDESGIADLVGYHEQCGYAVAGALPWSVGGYVA